MGDFEANIWMTTQKSTFISHNADEEHLTNVIEYEITGGFITFQYECPLDGKTTIIYPAHAVERVAIRKMHRHPSPDGKT